MIPHNRLTFSDAEVTAAIEVVNSGYWACGHKVDELETRLREMTGRKYAIAVSSGSAALQLALRSVGVDTGDRVVVPAYCCVAIPNAVLALNGWPVEVGVDVHWNADPEAVKLYVHHERAKAVVVVNTFGMPAEIPEADMPVVEDCAHGFWRSKMGSRSLVAITSFAATKLVGSGGGGAILTDSQRIAKFAYEHRSYAGKKASSWGQNFEMSDLHAAIAIVQLQRLEVMLSARDKVAVEYDMLLKDCNQLQLPQKVEGRVWYRYSVMLANGWKVEEVSAEMRKAGVIAERPVLPWTGRSRADQAYRQTLSLPLYPTLRQDEQAEVVTALLEAVS